MQRTARPAILWAVRALKGPQHMVGRGERVANKHAHGVACAEGCGWGMN
jgi:hypothetical protein